jgi:AbrB family looped-hinge helix DNA binding protein
MSAVATKLTQKGQVTIPRALRDEAGLKPRDIVTVEVEGDTVKIRLARSRVAAGYARVKSRRGQVDAKTLRDEFERGVAEEVMKETS